MRHVAISLSVLLGMLLSGPAFADDIGTIRRGDYRCELPGDATGPAGFPVEEEAFAITTGSSYAAADGGGSYLLVGNTLTMTSGPKRGQKYRRLSNSFLRKLAPDGSESPLRCVRLRRTNR